MSERRYDLSNKDDLAEVVRTGLVWDGPGWAVKMAIDAINSGDLPVPTGVPDKYAAYITRDEEPVAPVDPLAGGAAYDAETPDTGSDRIAEDQGSGGAEPAPALRGSPADL